MIIPPIQGSPPPLPPPFPPLHSPPPQLSTLDLSLANQKWGSWHCDKFKFGGKCDLCKHMKEKETIESFYYSSKFKIHGYLSHDYSPVGKILWFIYSIEDIPCHKIIIGSTQSPVQIWSNYKSTCNSETSKSTGLAKHFMDGCPFDQGKEKMSLSFSLIDFYDTTQDKITKECNNLKELEDRWILKMGSFYGILGLNSRDEVKSKTRCTWK